MQYRRVRIKGGTFFFTVVTHNRKPILTLPENIDRLRSAFRHVVEKFPFKIHSIVILPDHLHTIWELPEEDGDFSGRWSKIKRYFTVGCVGAENAVVSQSRRKKREKAVWQRRFWEHMIRDENDFYRHMDYIHFNPVRHGYVKMPRLWSYSSFMKCVGQGLYSSDWGAIEPESIHDMCIE